MVPRNQKWLIVLVLLLLGGTLIVVVFDRPPALPAVMILPPSPLTVKSGRAPDRWIPANWVWLRRTCLSIFGQPRQVGFDIECIEASETVAAIIAKNSLGQPQAESNGVAIWMLPEATLGQPSGPARIMPRARASTLDREKASLGVGDYSADLFAGLEKETVDLSTRLMVISSGQTNFTAAARAHLPYGKALLILDVRQPELATNRFEFLITADEIDARGNRISHAQASGK
jgi:hypothetical protein